MHYRPARRRVPNVGWVRPSRGDDRCWGSDGLRVRQFDDATRADGPLTSRPVLGAGPRRRDAFQRMQSTFVTRGSGCGAPSRLIRRPCSVALGATVVPLSLAGKVCLTHALTKLTTHVLPAHVLTLRVLTAGSISMKCRHSIDEDFRPSASPVTGMPLVRLCSMPFVSSPSAPRPRRRPARTSNRRRVTASPARPEPCAVCWTDRRVEQLVRRGSTPAPMNGAETRHESATSFRVRRRLAASPG